MGSRPPVPTRHGGRPSRGEIRRLEGRGAADLERLTRRGRPIGRGESRAPSNRFDADWRIRSNRTSRLVACLLAAPSAVPAADVADRFDIGDGRKIYAECRGAPPVVIVAGAEASAADRTEAPVGAPNVLDAVAAFTRVCAYDRPGAPVGYAPSRSDPVPQPVTAADSVGDLRALLAAADVAAPVVLVAHSWGGLVARLYAMRHVTDADGGHEIHKDQPGFVVDSIRAVVVAARVGRAAMAP